MSVLPIVMYGTPSLHETSVPVAEITDEIRRLAADMIETMYAAKGIGLAAPQIGRNIRLFVADADQVEIESRNPRVFINPEIVEESVEDEPYTEGCLSIPGVEGEVWRPSRVRVRAKDEHGNAFELEAEDLLARVIQHETDHLNGVLFIDRMEKSKRALLAGKLSALRRETEEALGAGAAQGKGGEGGSAD
ncbi:MAG: peptide deformylase [Candidatus Sumerlaeia bacterium]|nr:peptide deformylase [Candidatus Sumerlaeia bacterium]